MSWLPVVSMIFTMLFRLLSALRVIYVFIASTKRYAHFLSFCPLLNVLSAVLNVRNFEFIKILLKKGKISHAL